MSDPKPSAWQLVQQALRGDEQDYTRLPLRRAVFLLAVPMVMEMAMESLFAIADIFWVSRLGADAVATVGLTESLIAIVYAIAMGLSVAATAVVARRVGEGDGAAATLAAGQVLSLALAISALLGVLGAWAAPHLLGSMGASADVLRVGTRYAQLMLGGSATVILPFALNALFRGAGDAAMAMRSLFIANLANIVLGPIFIFGLGPLPAQGVTGAAIATCVGRGLGVCYQLMLLLAPRRSRLRVRAGHLLPRPDALGNLLRLAAAGTLQSLLETTSWLGLVRILSTFGSAALAGYTIAMRIVVFAVLPSLGLANAAATLVGQNLGASQPERAERAVWVVGAYNFAFLSAVSLVFSLVPDSLAQLFTREPEELRHAVSCLRSLGVGLLCSAFGMVLVQAFNGAGDTRTPTLLNVLAFWCFKIPLAYVLALQLQLGPRGVFGAIAAAYTFQALMAVIVFRRGAWKLKRV